MLKKGITFFSLIICTNLFCCFIKKNEKNKPFNSKLKENKFIKLDTQKYDIYDIDFDKDGKIDKILCDKHLLGDSLYVYKKIGSKYALSLKTINFSEDGIYAVKNIYSIKSKKPNLVISTYFNGSGGMKQKIFLTFNSNVWKISKTIFETKITSSKCKIKYCTIIQDLILNKNTDWSNYKNIDESKKTDCTIK
jgi:hypothetical protein